MKFRWLGIAMVSALLFGACGDDDTSSTKDAGMDAGGAGTGNAGTGGNNKDSAVAPVTIECGTKTCEKPVIDTTGIDAGSFDPSLLEQFAPSEACCAGTGEDLCGVSSSVVTGGECVELDQEGEADQDCPAYSESIDFGGIKVPIELPSCCRPDNKCGFRIDAIGVGCVERGAFAKFAAMGAAAGAMLDGGNVDAGAPVEAISCTFGGDDAGSEDGGN